MSYSNQINEADNTLGKVSNDHLLTDVKNGIGIIHGYTLNIRQIALDGTWSPDNSTKVLSLVQDGKIKIQEISKKLSAYSKRKNFTHFEELQKKHTVEQLSKRYLEAVKNFERESKNYMSKFSVKGKSALHFGQLDNLVDEENDPENFSRNTSSPYDSSKEGISVNIYDYNFDLNKYEQINNSKNNIKSKKVRSEISSEFQSIDSTIAENGKKKLKKKPYISGSKYKEINEYLLKEEFEEDKMKKHKLYDGLHYEDKQLVPVNTVDIENEILKQKNKEIQKLHRDIISIQELYKELSEQINVQGENLDNIDTQIANTHQNIVMSGREIQITRNRYSRNFRCLFFLILFMLLLIIIIMVVFKII